MGFMEKKKNPVGRPTKYKPQYCQELIDHMTKGLSYECFIPSDQYVRTSTLYEWEKKFPDFSEAKATAFHKNRIFWESIGVNQASGIVQHDVPGNATAYVFNMKNRFNWSDKRQVTIEDNSKYDEQLKALKEQLKNEKR